MQHLPEKSWMQSLIIFSVYLCLNQSDTSYKEEILFTVYTAVKSAVWLQNENNRLKHEMTHLHYNYGFSN